MKVCVVGVGRMGIRHLEAVKEMGFEIAGIQDISVSALESVAKQFDLLPGSCFENLQEMLDKKKPQGIVIASTAPGHSQAVISAANSGVKYILCEKPMATSIPECHDMIRATRENGCILAVNHQRRYLELYKFIHEQTLSTKLGDLRSVSVTGSNFGLAMNASHILEMFMYLSGECINEIQFWADKDILPNPRGPQYQDNSGQLRALTVSGRRLHIEFGGDLGHGITTVYGYRNGQIVSDDLNGNVCVVIRKDVHLDLPTSRYGMPAEISNFNFSSADLIKSTVEIWKSMLAKKDYPSPEISRDVVVALVAADLSAQRKGESVNLSEVASSTKLFSWA